MASEVIEKYLEKYNSHVKLLSTLAIIVTSAIAIAGGYAWYKSNLWQPTVTVTSVDFTTAVAELVINGRAVTLYGNDTMAAGGTWGVAFGTTSLGSTQYDTIQLIKNGMVYDVLNTKS
jgi:hypothetical protein